MRLLVPQTSQSSRHGRYYVAPGSWERMKNMFSLCFLYVAQAGGRTFICPDSRGIHRRSRMYLLRMWPRLAMGDGRR